MECASCHSRGPDLWAAIEQGWVILHGVLTDPYFAYDVAICPACKPPITVIRNQQQRLLPVEV